MRSREEGIEQLRYQIDHQSEKSGTDEPQRQAFALPMHPGQLPYHHHRGRRCAMSESSPKPARATEQAA